MRIDIITAFPEYFEAPLAASIMGRAVKKELISVRIHNLRDYTEDRHRQIDDYPYGGGAGMILKAEPIFNAVRSIENDSPDSSPRVIYLSPDGAQFTQNAARSLSQADHLVFLSGHYKGIDERVRQRLVDEEISIGDYVVTGGELPALVVIDAVVRLLPGVLGNFDSAATDSFQSGLLDHPHYTRPEVFDGDAVPSVLLSGNHAEIARWREEMTLQRTKFRRNDLLTINK